MGVQLHHARPMSAARHSRRSGSVAPAVPKRGLHELQPQLEWHEEWGVGGEGDLLVGASITNHHHGRIPFNLGAEGVVETW